VKASENAAPPPAKEEEAAKPEEKAEEVEMPTVGTEDVKVEVKKQTNLINMQHYLN
jgi:hypothetical protein